MEFYRSEGPAQQISHFLFRQSGHHQAGDLPFFCRKWAWRADGGQYASPFACNKKSGRYHPDRFYMADDTCKLCLFIIKRHSFAFKNTECGNGIRGKNTGSYHFTHFPGDTPVMQGNNCFKGRKRTGCAIPPFFKKMAVKRIHINWLKLKVF